MKKPNYRSEAKFRAELLENIRANDVILTADGTVCRLVPIEEEAEEVLERVKKALKNE